MARGGKEAVKQAQAPLTPRDQPQEKRTQSTVAKKAASSDASGGAVDDAVEGSKGKGGGGLTWKEIIYDGLALIAMGTSAAAMVVEGSQIVNVVGIVCTLLGPAAAIQQHKISQLEDLRRTQNRLRERVNELEAENDRLSEENSRLEASAKKLRETEDALAEIGKVQGKNVDLMVKQLNEYREIQQDIKENLEASVIQNLISVVVRSDVDHDFVIDPEEVDHLIMRLNNINGVKFNERNFRRAIEGTGYSLRAVLDIAKNLLDDTVSDRDNIFVIDAEGLLEKKRGKKKG